MQVKTLFKDINKKLRTGDVVGIRGIPGRTDLGELSILPRELTLLAPSLWKIPREWYEIKDPDIKYRKVPFFFPRDVEVPRPNRQQKHAGSLLQAKQSDFSCVFVKRQIIQTIRQFMSEEGFMDVETSILSAQAGGAVATPFITHSNTQNQDLALRISPELYLKELVVGGFDRVYDMGKVFRNEGLDNKHNFEFTSIEAYMAYHDYTDWMTLSEKLLNRILY
jgi:lysine--tRNA ligase